jgi:hypothetical protein
VGRVRWFIAGAGTAAAAILATSGGRSRVRRLAGRGEHPELEAGDAPTAATASAQAVTPGPAYDLPLVDDDTKELRLRIDETRDRIRRRTQDVTAADADPAS